MVVAFNAIPGNLRVPLFYAEFNSAGSPFAGYSRQVLVGHKLSSGIAPVGMLINIGGTDPRLLFGNGSMLCDKAVYAREMDPIGELYALVIAEPSSPTAASGTVAFSGTATNAGTMARWVAGEMVAIAYAVGDTAAVLAARFAAALNAGYVKFNRAMLFPVTTSVSTGTVTLTARHGGTIGNAIRIDTDLDPGYSDPAGITITHAPALTAGAGDVDFAVALALMGSAPAEWIAAPFVTTTQLNAARAFLGDTGSGRWAPMQQLHGHYTTVKDDTLSNLTSFGNGRNDRHTTIVGVRNAPHPPWCWAAAVNGALGFSKNLSRPLSEAVEIARPMQTIVLNGLRAPKLETDRWSPPDRQSLYSNGIGACVVRADGQVAIDRLVTTEQFNAFNQPDATFLDVETLAQSAYVGRYMRNVVETNFPRHVLKDDNPRRLQGVVTPKTARDVIIHAYGQLCDEAGICEGKERFARDVIVERSSDPNRLNAYLPVDTANQLRVFAANIAVSTQIAA
jgi:phage tail sheath gpL-like